LIVVENLTGCEYIFGPARNGKKIVWREVLTKSSDGLAEMAPEHGIPILESFSLDDDLRISEMCRRYLTVVHRRKGGEARIASVKTAASF
jgi:hypothetical protein